MWQGSWAPPPKTWILDVPDSIWAPEFVSYVRPRVYRAFPVVFAPTHPFLWCNIFQGEYSYCTTFPHRGPSATPTLLYLYPWPNSGGKQQEIQCIKFRSGLKRIPTHSGIKETAEGWSTALRYCPSCSLDNFLRNELLNRTHNAWQADVCASLILGGPSIWTRSHCLFCVLRGSQSLLFVGMYDGHGLWLVLLLLLLIKYN